MTTMYPVVKTVDAVAADGMVQLSIARTDGKKGKSGLCIVVPAVSDSVLTLVTQQEIGKAWITDCIDDLRSKIASAINKAGNTITSDKIGIDALLAQMKIDSESQRMTKDAVGAWFDADLAGLIAAAFKAKEQYQNIADDKLALIVASYKTAFQSLAGRDVSMSAPVKAGLIKAMELLPEGYEHIIGNRVAEKLVDVSEQTEVFAAL